MLGYIDYNKRKENVFQPLYLAIYSFVSFEETFLFLQICGTLSFNT